MRTEKYLDDALLSNYHQVSIIMEKEQVLYDKESKHT